VSHLRSIPGGGQATGRVELQAITAANPPAIGTVRCESLEQARAAGANALLDTSLSLALLRIVFNGSRTGAIDLLKESA